MDDFCSKVGCLMGIILALSLGIMIGYQFAAEGLRQQVTQLTQRYDTVNTQYESEKALSKTYQKALSEIKSQCDREVAGLKVQLQQLQSQREAEAKAAALLARSTPAESGISAVSSYLRQEHRQGTLIGDGVRVAYLLSTDGFVTFRWEIDWNRVGEPNFVMKRDQRLVRSDWGRIGEFRDQLRLGHRYLYVFSIFDRQSKARLIGKRLKLELVVPAADVWDSQPPGTPKSEKRSSDQQRDVLEENLLGFVATETWLLKVQEAIEAVMVERGTPAEQVDEVMQRVEAKIAELREGLNA